MEEAIVDHLNIMIPTLNGIFIEDDEQKECKKKAASILRLCGRFSPASSFEPICVAIINLKTTENEDLSICGLTTYRHLIEGYLEALPAGEGLLNKSELIQRALKTMGSSDFLDYIIKPMLTPFAEFFECIFSHLNKIATENEKEDFFTNYRPQIVKIALTAISIPVFLLVTDNVPEVNFRLIKSCIDNTAKLKTDKDAQPYLEILDQMRQKDPQVLLNEIYAINTSKVAKSSNDLLAICSLMNYYLFEHESYGFLDAGIIFECAVKEKETLSKLVLNMNSYCSFYVRHC